MRRLDDTELPVGLRDLQGIPVRKDRDGLDTTELLAAVRALVDQARDQAGRLPSAGACTTARVARVTCVSPLGVGSASSSADRGVRCCSGAGGLAWMMMSLGQGRQDRAQGSGRRLAQPSRGRAHAIASKLRCAAACRRSTAEAKLPKRRRRKPRRAANRGSSAVGPPPGGRQGHLRRQARLAGRLQRRSLRPHRRWGSNPFLRTG